MVYIVGAGSGAADLITVRGARLLGQADVIIYAGSLVNPEVLSYAKNGCQIHNSAKMTLEEVVEVMANAHFHGQNRGPAAHRRPLHLWGHPGADGRAATKRTSPLRWCPASPAFAGRRRPFRRNTPCPASARR